MQHAFQNRHGWSFLGLFRPDEAPDERDANARFPIYDGIEAAARLTAREFWLTSPSDVPADTLLHCVNDFALPKLLAWEGRLVLHCGMVAEDAGAVGFLGPSGAGKSTMTAAFVRDGAQLLSDDAMVIYPEEETLGARPLYSGLRLLPDSIAELLPDAQLGENMAHYSEKRRLLVDDGAEMAYPRALFLLENAAETQKIELLPMTPSDACMTLLWNSFSLDPTNRVEAARRFELASDVARRLPVFTLRYPRRYETLPEAMETIRLETKL